MYKTYLVSEKSRAKLEAHVRSASLACNMAEFWEVAEKVAFNRGLEIVGNKQDGYSVLTDRITVSIPDTADSPQEMSTEGIDSIVDSWTQRR